MVHAPVVHSGPQHARLAAMPDQGFASSQLRMVTQTGIAVTIADSCGDVKVLSWPKACMLTRPVLMASVLHCQGLHQVLLML